MNAKLNFILSCLLVYIGSSCSTSDESPTPAATGSALKDNTWKLGDKLYVASAYGRGWASSDFSPAFGLTDATTDPKGTKMIEIIFLEKPKASGKYTVEDYSEIKLNAVRSNKITGLKLAFECTDNTGNISRYQSKAGTAGTVDITVTGSKFKAGFKDITLTDAVNSNNKAQLSGIIVE